jgi:ribosomal-protein-alanine N-acetyltransferase
VPEIHKMNDIKIIYMSEDHIDDILTVENSSFKIPWSRQSFLDELSNKFAIYISAQASGRIIGYAGMWKVFDEGHITNVAVHPDLRGQGVGSLLVAKLLEISEAEEITALTLEVRRSNIAAQHLYAKFGFEASGVRKAYYADNGEDAIIMWKRDG